LSKLHKVLHLLLAFWLISWIVLSWAAIQDDALIHLRYADNLFRLHMVSYDGIHRSYGASSLLYVSLLAVLRSFTLSPNLPRLVSSAVHILLVTGLAFTLDRLIPRESARARFFSLTLLFVLVTPSAVRWLDDGMETGLILCFVTAICAVSFLQAKRETTTALQYIAFAVLALFAILLRTELLLLCFIASAIIMWSRRFPRSGDVAFRQKIRSVSGSSHLLVGSFVALATILLTMGSLLPDTALAKSDGIANWLGVLSGSVHVLAGAMTFGIGLLVLWLATLLLVILANCLSVPVAFANAVFPILIVLACLRGQQIQGARYLVWTFYFSVIWNILELSRCPLQTPKSQRNVLGIALLTIFLVALPFEIRTMHHVLTARARTLEKFEGEHLEELRGKRGIAMDIGYIGYFSKADICDLAGLVNGREQATRKPVQRAEFCVANRPEFIFLSESQLGSFQQFMDTKDWQVCSHYDFINVSSPDTHYLLVPPGPTAAQTCKSASNSTLSPIAQQ
jgi:hypothetical protein